ncbi:MAG: radical SAM protein [Chitinivibrionales bacterium]|nr:radical SAM protein [Chitinivibrionales bacterium]
MSAIIHTPNVTDKLTILSQGSQYDLACACSTGKDDRRYRSGDGKWVYPVTLPGSGERRYLFKTLISNVCVNDCGYCPFRVGRDTRRCTVEPEELVRIFLEYYRAGRVMGLFVSSGIAGTADRSMERINAIASILRRRERFRGYLHLKVLPGASDAAIEEAMGLASTVSINLETAGEGNFARLCTDKRYEQDVIRPLRFISDMRLGREGYRGVKQTTQFVVGASNETDRDLVNYTYGLYKKLGLDRVYFSAYQRGLGSRTLPGECSRYTDDQLLTREHRLYQVDWLLRKYGFSADEIPVDDVGNLSLEADPKAVWAERHPDFFPVDINCADRLELLRVPGLGEITVGRILERRARGGKVRSWEDVGVKGGLRTKAAPYVKL